MNREVSQTLKTLKEIETYLQDKEFQTDKLSEKDICFSKLNLIQEIRQEAIKWIKELDTGSHYEYEIQYDDGDYGESTASNVINWIKHFFNITDKELE